LKKYLDESKPRISKRDSSAAGVEIKEKLRRIAAFGSFLRDPNKSAGQWRLPTGKGTAREPKTMVYLESRPELHHFCQTAYAAGWIMQNFDWMRWSERLKGSNYWIAALPLQAPKDQLGRLLTALIRGERFCEGTSARAHQQGTLLAIVERAETLLAAARSGRSRNSLSRTSLRT
jgi:hypothetical protein